jgi:hypothetical protein
MQFKKKKEKEDLATMGVAGHLYFGQGWGGSAAPWQINK